MASCITRKSVNSVSPQVRLTVTIDSAASTTTTAALDWVTEYVAHGYAADIGSRTWSGKIGNTSIGGTFSASDVTGVKEMDRGTVIVTRTNVSQTIEFSISFPFNMSWSGQKVNTETAKGAISVPAISSYTITYNANGGTGTPAVQTKSASSDVKLTTATPTRTGYTFLGWATSATGNVAYAPGATYSTNANVTLYAIWTPTVYTVTYNANGGTGAPTKQTKTYDETITLYSTIPTRTNYSFVGWGVFASATTVSYTPGATYTANESITLYAIWEIAYTKPRITDFNVSRCDANGNFSENGTYAIATFHWETDKPVSSIKITWVNGEVTVTPSGSTSGTESKRFGGSFSENGSYQIILIVTDTQSSLAYEMLRGATFIIDGLPQNKGVAFGKPAEMEGYAEFEFKAKFNSNVEGKVLGLAGVPPVPSGCDMNTLVKYGVYSIGSNTIAESLVNGPKTKSAGTVRVYSANGSGIEGAAYDYIIQEYLSFTGVLERRTLNNGSANTYTPTSDWFTPGGVNYVIEEGTSGIWRYRKWKDGKVELWGKYTISNVACTTALGGMYRTPAIVPTNFPFNLSNIYLTANYESDGYGAILWATTQCTSTTPSNYYLIRPTSATIASGVIVMKVIATLA